MLEAECNDQDGFWHVAVCTVQFCNHVPLVKWAVQLSSLHFSSLSFSFFSSFSSAGILLSMFGAAGCEVTHLFSSSISFFVSAIYMLLFVHCLFLIFLFLFLTRSFVRSLLSISPSLLSLLLPILCFTNVLAIYMLLFVRPFMHLISICNALHGLLLSLQSGALK